MHHEMKDKLGEVIAMLSRMILNLGKESGHGQAQGQGKKDR
jgi:hypothetical protein